ncbi:hypothetical protein EVAR_65275_1 [Eumeta japonica]|uniref:Uncharacterized protein n=1 Tax=Eumeta variegata TaxID=151549 RepID=A0A4C1ZAN9_EUMVA|nr:hypothetical protein EVAR_65275_1 [Eumeta japonica]
MVNNSRYVQANAYEAYGIRTPAIKMVIMVFPASRTMTEISGRVTELTKHVACTHVRRRTRTYSCPCVRLALMNSYTRARIFAGAIVPNEHARRMHTSRQLQCVNVVHYKLEHLQSPTQEWFLSRRIGTSEDGLLQVTPRQRRRTAYSGSFFYTGHFPEQRVRNTVKYKLHIFICALCADADGDSRVIVPSTPRSAPVSCRGRRVVCIIRPHTPPFIARSVIARLESQFCCNKPLAISSDDLLFPNTCDKSKVGSQYTQPLLRTSADTGEISSSACVTYSEIGARSNLKGLYRAHKSDNMNVFGVITVDNSGEVVLSEAINRSTFTHSWTLLPVSPALVGCYYMLSGWRWRLVFMFRLYTDNKRIKKTDKEHVGSCALLIMFSISRT